MRTVVIHHSVAGGELNVVFNVNDDGDYLDVRTSSIIPDDAIVFHSKSSRGHPDVDQSLNIALELEGISNLVQIDQKYLNMCNEIHVDPFEGNMNWSTVMTNDDYVAYIKKLVSNIASHITEVSFEYFDGTWRSTTSVFSSLRQCRIDTCVVDQSPIVQRSLSDQFDPMTGICKRIIYDRNATRTGRLKVASGLNVLNFPKKARNVFTSVYENGMIVSVDFKSIEARIAWVLGDCDPTIDDLYVHIDNEFFEGRLSRNVVKIAVLSLLYGQGPKALSENLNCSIENATKFSRVLKRIFHVERRVQSLKRIHEMTGAIRNAYNRRVQIDDSSDHILYNSFIQSTTVDVVLLGILQMINGLNSDIRPLFMIHDEMYFDCPSYLFDELSVAANNVSIDISGKNIRLPITIKVISKRGN